MQISHDLRVQGDAPPACRPPLPAATAGALGALAFALVIPLAGCGDAGSKSGSATAGGGAHWSIDDAAIANAPSWTVDSLPLADTQRAGGDSSYAFNGVDHVQLLTDGRFVVLDPNRAQVLVFGADGRPLRRFGEVKAGDRRFRSPSGLLRLVGDTLLLPDPSRDSIYWIHPDSGVVKARTFSGSTTLTEIRLQDHVGIIGRRLVGSGIRTGPGWSTRDEDGRSIIIVGSSNFAGEGVEQIATVLGPSIAQFDTTISGRRFAWNEEPRFAQWPAFAVWDTLVVQSTGAAAPLRVTTVHGKDVATLELKHARRPVTEAIRRADVERQFVLVLERGRSRFADSTRRRGNADSIRQRQINDSIGRRALMEKRPSEDSLPRLDALRQGAGGLLWVVRRGLPAGDPWSALAIAPGGRLVGRLVGPGQGTPTAFSADRVLVHVQDDTGKSRMLVYRFHPPQ